MARCADGFRVIKFEVKTRDRSFEVAGVVAEAGIGHRHQMDHRGGNVYRRYVVPADMIPSSDSNGLRLWLLP